MNSSNYLISARTLAVLLLLVVYLGVDVARFNLSRSELLKQLWRQTGRTLVESYLNQEKVSWGELQQQEPFDKWKDIGQFRQVRIEWWDEHKSAGPKNIVVTFRGPDGQPHKETFTTNPTIPAPFIEINRIAIRAEASQVQPNKLAEGVSGIYNQLINRVIEVPGIGLKFSSERAVWVAGLVTFMMLTLIRNRIRWVYHDANLALGEPWLVLDGYAGIERLTALAWLALIMLSPWIVWGSTLAVITDYTRVTGSLTSWTQDVVSFLLLCLLMIISGWQALWIATMVIHLRHARLKLARSDSQG